MNIGCIDIYGNKYEFDKLEYIERKAVYGIAVKDKQLLLVKDKWIKKWGLPGGGLKKGEKPEEALIREFKEETGYIISSNIKEIFKNDSYFLAPGNKHPWKTKRKIFLVLIIDGTLKQYVNKFDVIQAKYFPFNKILEMKNKIRENDMVTQTLLEMKNKIGF